MCLPSRISGAGDGLFARRELPAGAVVAYYNGLRQGCQMAKFDPFLSLDCARVEGVGAQSKERKGSNFAA